MRRPPLVTDQFYHVFNRGVDGRRTFEDVRGHRRFVCALIAFNDKNGVYNFNDLLPTNCDEEVFVCSRTRQLLVDVVAYALMPNHYHLLLRQRVDRGISLFLQKLGIGYTSYFNLRHKRTGVLFQGKFQVRAIQDNRYLRHLVVYLHLNPLSLAGMPRRRKATGHPDAVLKFIERYRWSSCQAYLQGFRGAEDAALLNTDLITKLGLPVGEAHRQDLRGWVQNYRRRTALLGDLITVVLQNGLRRVYDTP